MRISISYHILVLVPLFYCSCTKKPKSGLELVHETIEETKDNYYERMKANRSEVPEDVYHYISSRAGNLLSYVCNDNIKYLAHLQLGEKNNEVRIENVRILKFENGGNYLGVSKDNGFLNVIIEGMFRNEELTNELIEIGDVFYVEINNLCKRLKHENSES